MANVRVGAALASGLGLIRRRPLAVMAWGAVMALTQMVSFLLFAPALMRGLEPLADLAQGRPIQLTPTPSDVATLQAWQLVFNIAQVALVAMVNAAVFRAVLRPDQSRAAYLRFGLIELMLVAMTVLAFIGYLALLIVVLLPVGILLVVLGASGSAPTAAFGLVVIAVGAVLVVALSVLVAVRFGLAGPMVVRDGRFHLFDAWILTRGQVRRLIAMALPLLAVGALQVALVLGLEVVIGAAFQAQATGMATVIRQPLVLAGRLAPQLALYLVVATPIYGCLAAFFNAPWASAARDLEPDTSAVFS